MSIVPIEEIERDIRNDKVACPEAIDGLLDQIRLRDDLIQRMSVYAGGGHRPDIAGRLESVEVAIKLLAGHATAMMTELLVIKALLAERQS